MSAFRAHARGQDNTNADESSFVLCYPCVQPLRGSTKAKALPVKQAPRQEGQATARQQLFVAPAPCVIMKLPQTNRPTAQRTWRLGWDIEPCLTPTT